MRTGKTKVIIDTACHLYKAGKLNTVLIFAPNGVHRNWLLKEFPAHVWRSVPVATWLWETEACGSAGGNKLGAERKRKWEERRAHWWDTAKQSLTMDCLTVFAFNSESVTRDDVRYIIARLAKKRKCMAVWDESTDFRTPGSKRTKMMRALARRTAYRRILEGTV